MLPRHEEMLDDGHELGERFLTDDGTMEGVKRRVSPASTPVFEEAVVFAQRLRFVVGALVLGAAIGMAVVGAQSQQQQRSVHHSQVFEPWMVLHLQDLALYGPNDPSLDARAVAAGEAYLASSQEGPWTELIRKNHLLVEAHAQSSSRP